MGCTECGLHWKNRKPRTICMTDRVGAGAVAGQWKMTSFLPRSLRHQRWRCVDVVRDENHFPFLKSSSTSIPTSMKEEAWRAGMDIKKWKCKIKVKTPLCHAFESNPFRKRTFPNPCRITSGFDPNRSRTKQISGSTSRILAWPPFFGDNCGNHARQVCSR